MATRLYPFLVALSLSTASLATAADNATPPSNSVKSMLGGLFHRRPPAPQDSGTANGGMPDCDQIAKNKYAHTSKESCEQMTQAKQAYDAAASDPSAQRPGDEQMTCEQIFAELKQQSFTKPDQTKVAAAQSAVSSERSQLAKDQAEVNKTIAEESAAMAAAAATDRATELATGGIVNPNRTGKLAEKFDKENRAKGERMAEARAPTERKVMSSTASLMSDAGQQLTANPRMARLMQLANAKRCKGS